MSASASLVGIDWGTSAFRAALLDTAGRVLDRREGPHGIMAVPDGDFAGVLRRETEGWLGDARLPVLMSGMIGSRQGWVEAAYVTCPAGLDEVAAGLMQVPFSGADVSIVPGMESVNRGMRDLMRGEETQVFGALAGLGLTDGRFVLPGTHSKWVQVEEGRITGFSTFMTGEVYAACRGHTILGRLMQEGPFSDGAFKRGVEAGASTAGPGALLNRLFGVRTAGLFGDIPGTGLADYMSGMFIGAEVAEAGNSDETVRIIASGALNDRYRLALGELGMRSEVLDSDLAVAGQWAIARAAGLVSSQNSGAAA